MAREWYLSIQPRFDSVWYKTYYIKGQNSAYQLSMDKQGWWYLAKARMTRTPEDIGPFNSKEAAAACFETLI